MNDINLGLAFARYLSNPSAESVEAVVVALEGRPDMPIKPDETRRALLAGIAEVKRAHAGSATSQTAMLMQRLLGRKA